MGNLEEITNAAFQLSAADKIHLLQAVARGLATGSEGIEVRADVCDGVPCISGTRIPVWLLEQARRLGSTEAQLLAAYPTLRAVDLVNAWRFVDSHTAEIDRQIRENEDA